MSDLTAVAAVLTALAAVVIAPVVTYFSTKKQIRASVVSLNRQAWIDKLRDELAELFELLNLHLLSRPGTLTVEDEAQNRSRIRLLTNKVRLRLNPLEQDSRTLLDLLIRLNEAATEDRHGGETEFGELMESAVTTAQTILKAEWTRVKDGE